MFQALGINETLGSVIQSELFEGCDVHRPKESF